MGGPQPPFIYEPQRRDDGRFPTISFDPKAVTRASFEPRRSKPKPNGPLVSFNQHPDYHEIRGPRFVYWTPMSGRTKWWIKAMRVVQLVARALELIGAVGLLALAILLTRMPDVAAWVLRIVPGCAMLHCAYGVFHLSRAAGSRTPGSSAAYHVFAGLSDLCILPFFAYGALATHDNGSRWGTLLSEQSVAVDYFVPAVYYTLIGDGALHVFSLLTSLWLALMFRRILKLPPDMNPLEQHLTARPHKRNKSSVSSSACSETEKRLSTPLEDRRRSGAPGQDTVPDRTVPFLHTRQGSGPSTPRRDSRVDLPSRHYQILPGTSPSSPRRDSTGASADQERAPAPPPRSPFRSSYAGLPQHEPGTPPPPQPPPSAGVTTGTVASYRATPAAAPPQHAAAQAAQPRAATWYASASLMSRSAGTGPNRHTAYEALAQPYDDDDDDENCRRLAGDDDDDDDDNDGYDDGAGDGDLGAGRHPNPLRSNPLAAAGAAGRLRNSSIQGEDEFVARPYGELRGAAPPAAATARGGRQVSSGTDYGGGGVGASVFGRRKVSGKVAEEGRGGRGRWAGSAALDG